MADSDYFSQPSSRPSGDPVRGGRELSQLQTSKMDPSHSRSTDSWIEVPSRPSTSSLSSAADETNTSALRAQQEHPHRRKRRLQTRTMLRPDNDTSSPSVGGSSQDEYEESESESDRVMTSSNEGVAAFGPPNRASFQGMEPAAASDDDEDESATALGVASTEQCFTPQPNAFTHPPSSHSLRSQTSIPTPAPEPAPEPAPHIARPPARSLSQRHSHPTQPQHGPYNAISPSHHIDHDAALRASLSTLLSCAAAARGLPKSTRGTTTRPSTRVEPTALRIVPESAIEDESPPAQPPLPLGRRVSSASDGSGDAAVAAAADKGKRKARSASKERRAAKKLRHGVAPDDAVISPTLMTWVLSAGVLVVVSALSFSAGYVVGRETGRVEGAENMGSWLGSGVESGGACAREVGRGSGLGLRRWRPWGGAGVVVSA